MFSKKYFFFVIWWIVLLGTCGLALWGKDMQFLSNMGYAGMCLLICMHLIYCDRSVESFAAEGVGLMGYLQTLVGFVKIFSSLSTDHLEWNAVISSGSYALITSIIGWAYSYMWTRGGQAVGGGGGGPALDPQVINALNQLLKTIDPQAISELNSAAKNVARSFEDLAQIGPEIKKATDDLKEAAAFASEVRNGMAAWSEWLKGARQLMVDLEKILTFLSQQRGGRV